MGSWGARSVHSGALGVPGPGGFHRWRDLDVVGVVGTDARIGLSGCDGLGLAVSVLVDLVGVVVGGPQGSGPVSSIVVQCAGLQSWWWHVGVVVPRMGPAWGKR